MIIWSSIGVEVIGAVEPLSGVTMVARSRLMSTIKIDLDDDLAALLQQTNQPVQSAAREMIVLELYRRGTVSSGKAAELLGMPRLTFIQHASRLGIPHIDMTADEWEAEKTTLNEWPAS